MITKVLCFIFLLFWLVRELAIQGNFKPSEDYPTYGMVFLTALILIATAIDIFKSKEE